jgi:hypothetical protein
MPDEKEASRWTFTDPAHEVAVGRNAAMNVLLVRGVLSRGPFILFVCPKNAPLTGGG